MRSNDIKGLILVIVVAISALWLAGTDQLNLYIHPRYITVTVIFAAVAVIAAVMAGRYAGTLDEIELQDEPVAGVKKWRLGAALIMIVCLFGALALIAVKPAALTSLTATQRGVNVAAAGMASSDIAPAESPLFGSDNYDNLTIRDWSGLLAQVDDPEFFVGRTVDLTGFVVADERDAKNMFYVSRFVVTCCAVDARPIGVPVHLPGWQQRFKQDQWLHVKGSFVVNPSILSIEKVAVSADVVEPTAKPEQTYDF